MSDLRKVSYWGLLWTPTECGFLHAFTQVDLAANGNDVTVNGGGNITQGVLTEQNLIYVDLALGRWLMRNRHSHCMRGLAAVIEVHYTGTLQEADSVSAGLPMGNGVTFGRNGHRFDVANLTVGLHMETCHRTRIRIGGVVPLVDAQARFFDAEVMLSAIKRY